VRTAHIRMRQTFGDQRRPDILSACSQHTGRPAIIAAHRSFRPCLAGARHPLKIEAACSNKLAKLSSSGTLSNRPAPVSCVVCYFTPERVPERRLGLSLLDEGRCLFGSLEAVADFVHFLNDPHAASATIQHGNPAAARVCRSAWHARDT